MNFLVQKTIHIFYGLLKVIQTNGGDEEILANGIVLLIS
jgi:hypothetical protein